jgi:hypothetical protein
VRRHPQNSARYSPVGIPAFNFNPITLGAISFPIAPGDAGIRQTVDVIRKLVDDGVKDPHVNALAIRLARRVPRFDRMAQAQAIYEYVLENIWFVDDPVQKETVRPARVVLQVGGGDCDDINGVLLPSLLGTIGIATRLVTVASDPRDPTQFSHIYAEADIDGEWIPIDAARPGAQFGLEPNNFTRKRLWSLDNSSFEDVVDTVTGAAGGSAAGAALEASGLFGLNGYLTLGDDSTDAQDELAAAPLVAAGTVGIADIIAASQGSPYASYGNPVSYAQYGMATSPSMAAPAGIPTTPASSLTSLMPLLILGIVGLVIARAVK